ncbi:MAG TPA: radical SAM protein, partial [Candidatus Latescibacteria bacterium]|nr:radical SAM protein [Candidatus Latescibacterota bacterium]
EGCVFRCAYCGFGRRVHFTLDVDRLIGELEAVFAKHPEQRLYKFSNMTDLPAFEPEIDIVPPMVRRFSQETDRYLMLFTKSDNVAFLRDLDHRGHTIISWSLTADSPSRLLDKRTATMDERIAAMAEMQKAGYIVRARLSPIIPVRNWEKEYRALFEHMFACVQPDLVTLELLGWMKFDDLLAVIPPELLDGQMREEARAAADSLKDVMWAPFTQDAHEKVYRFCIDTVRELSPRTPVSVCHGTAATWKALGELTGMTPGEYICNCGPLSAPGGALYDELHALHDGEGQ